MGYAILIGVGAFILGVLADKIFNYLFGAIGTLRIDSISTDKDIYRLEINNLDILVKRKVVVLKVDNDADLSQ